MRLSIRLSKEFRSFLIFFFVASIIILLTKSVLGTGALIVGFMAIALLICLYTMNIGVLRYFVICTVFQNIILVLTASSISSTETTLVIVMKELLVYSAVVVYFISGRIFKLEKRDYIFISFSIILLLNLMQASSIRLAIVAMRQIMVVFSCFYFGKLIKLGKENNIEKIFNILLFYGVIVGILGIILYFCSDKVWLDMGFAEYWLNKTGGNTTYSFRNFYTFDLGTKLKRLVSTFAEPLSCSHFLGIGFVTAFLVGKRKNFVLKVFFTIVMMMGISKSSIVLVLSVILVLNYSKIKKSSSRVAFVIGCLLVGGAAMNVLSDYSSGLTQATSIGNHFNAFIYGIQNASFFGNGLGTTGYNASIMGLTEFDAGYNESFFALCIGQVGAVGTVLFYMFLISCFWTNFKTYKKTGNSYVLVSSVLMLELLIETLFSASSVSMLGTGLYCVLSGISSNIHANATDLDQEKEMDR